MNGQPFLFIWSSKKRNILQNAAPEVPAFCSGLLIVPSTELNEFLSSSISRMTGDVITCILEMVYWEDGFTGEFIALSGRGQEGSKVLQQLF